MTPRPVRPASPLALVALLVVTVEWGGGYVISKAVADATPPVLLSCARAAVAAVVLAPFAWRRRAQGPRVFWRTAGALGLTGGLLYSVPFHAGIGLTSATEAALVQGTLPAVAAVLAWVLGRDTPAPRRAAAVALAVAGGAVVAFASPAAGASSELGSALVALSVLAWAVYLLQVDRLAHADPVGVTFAASVGAALLLAPAAAAEAAWRSPQAASPEVWLGLLWLGAVSSGLSLLLYTYATQRLGAVAVAASANLMPVVAVGAAAVFLGERPGLEALVGGALVLLGVALLTVEPGREPEQIAG